MVKANWGPMSKFTHWFNTLPELSSIANLSVQNSKNMVQFRQCVNASLITKPVGKRNNAYTWLAWKILLKIKYHIFERFSSTSIDNSMSSLSLSLSLSLMAGPNGVLCASIAMNYLIFTLISVISGSFRANPCSTSADHNSVNNST